MHSSLRDTGDVLPGHPQEPGLSGTRAGRALRALLLALACAVLVGGYLVAGLVYQQAERERAEQLAQRTPVTATILEPAGHAGVTAEARQARARWTAPDGTTSTGGITADPSATAGDQRLIWTTPSGQPVSAPITPTQTALLSLGAGVGVGSGALALAIAAYRLPRRLATRQQMDALEAEWAEVEPQWSSR